jgi:hypothetical protein
MGFDAPVIPAQSYKADGKLLQAIEKAEAAYES